MKVKRCAGFYLLGFVTVLGLKLYGDRAGSEELLWILKPTAWWAGILGGYSFTYEQGTGYVSHSLRFIIAPACAGLNFCMISILMLIGSFVHRMNTRKKQALWTLLCVPASYTAAVFVNGIRIVLSIELPRSLRNAGEILRNVTQGQLHTAIGTAVYFLALLALYQAGGWCSRKMAGIQNRDRSCWKRVFPVFWYLGPVLGLPFLSRAVHRDYTDFAGYELPVLAVCGGILFVLGALRVLGKKMLMKRQR